MSNFWRGLETVYCYRGVSASWRRRIGDDFDRIKNSLLLPMGNEATSFPSGNICECNLRVVQHAPDHIVGISDCGSTSCNDIALTAGDIAILQLNEKKLARAIATALRVEACEVDLGIPGAKQIAVLGGVSMPIVLALAQNPRAFADVVQRLVIRLKEHFIFLAPSSRWLDGNLHGLLKHAKAGFFPLDMIITLMSNGTLHASKSGGELFSAYLPAVAEPTSDNDAVRLFALVKALELETKYRKAPVTRVFQLYCMDGESRNSVAKKCACAPSLITLRLKRLEKKLGRPPEELRQLSGHFEKIADSLTDSRARNVYRRGAMDEGEEE